MAKSFRRLVENLPLESQIKIKEKVAIECKFIDLINKISIFSNSFKIEKSESGVVLFVFPDGEVLKLSNNAIEEIKQASLNGYSTTKRKIRDLLISELT